MRQLVFALVLLAGLGTLSFSVFRLAKFMWHGRPGIPLDQIPSRLSSLVIYWLMQRKVMQKPADHPKFGFTSLHHLFIFWGFLVVTIGTVELWVYGLTGWTIPDPVKTPLGWMVDVFSLLVLIAVGFGFFRRLVIKPRLIPMSLD